MHRRWVPVEAVGRRSSIAKVIPTKIAGNRTIATINRMAAATTIITSIMLAAVTTTTTIIITIIMAPVRKATEITATQITIMV